MSTFSRRKFLGGLGASALALPYSAPWARRVSAPAAGAAAPAGPVFLTVPAAQSGIHWVHDNALSPMRYLPETVGSGCAFLDYDNDGWMDIFLVNTGRCDFFDPVHPPHNGLYKNNRDGTFTDVTAKAGVLGGVTFGMGVAVGDYDGDGYPDMYVTGYGHNILYHNNGDGTFTDVTEKAGLADPNWSTSAAWFDYDNDGKLDLFVCSFVKYSKNNKVFCGDNKLGKHYFCIPRVFEGRPSKLYRNNGDGTFTETGHLLGIGDHLCKAHGVVATDINNDGFLDLFVSNDTSANYLFLNHGGKHFEEIGFSAGVAYSEEGNPRSGMGVDSGDYDNDGWMDLYVDNIDHQRFALYRNDHDLTFTDVSGIAGIGAATELRSGWGIRFIDYDNDGWLDILQTDGHPDDMVSSYDLDVHYHEKPLLFHNNQHGGFTNVSAHAGPAFQRRWGSRGLATGDYDNDGRIDAIANNNGAAPLLLHNVCGGDGARNHWLGILLVGTDCNRDAVGARVRWGYAGQHQWRLKTAGGSFLSAHDPRMILGIGRAERVDWLEVRWPQPSGRVERFTKLPVDRYIRIVEGKGIVE